jgi:Ala-tRNA(Pro) deacylase
MAKLGDMIHYLKKNSIRYEVIEHTPAFTAQDTAIASHVPDKDLAKTLIFQSDDKYCMVVVPADYRLDEHMMGKAIKAEHLHLAQEEDLKPLFPDCELEAMPPFGNLYALPVYIDKSLTNDDEIVFHACSHTKSIKLKMDDYLGLVKPFITEFSNLPFEAKEQ